MDMSCTYRTVGDTSRPRQMGAAVVVLLGAGACAVATLAGWPLYQTLALLGAFVTVAWLLDGTSQRYLGPGLAALAVGGGITIYRALEMDASKGEHGIVYPLLGVALLVASMFNPLSMRGSGTFLVIVGFIATVSLPWASGYSLAGILLSWAALELGRISREGDPGQPQPAAHRTENGNSARTPVGAGTGRQ